MKPDPLKLYNPVPWFDASTLAGTSHNLGVMAGRWVALCFVGTMSDPSVTKTFAEIISSMGRLFNDDHLVFYGVMTKMPPDPSAFIEASHRGLGFMFDPDKKISTLYGAEDHSRLVVIDPLSRALKIFSLGPQGTSATDIVSYLKALPSVDESAGVPLTAPALIIPRVFEPEFCDTLVKLYEENGGKDSGFMIDDGGKTKTVIDHQNKQRYDFIIKDPSVREAIRERITARVLPAMERFFQYKPTRMDRYLVSCYGADGGGHFSRHRDNVNTGAQHRRFAASFNLNAGYEGCDLIFPEFGRRLYRAPVGGAIVFSTGALHQVTPITHGKRYAFVPFFYGEEEAKQRLLNNSNLHDGEGVYTGTQDMLFPE